MTKLKISSYSKQEDPKKEALPFVSLEAFVIKDTDEDAFSSKNISGQYFIIMTESEYRQKMFGKTSRKTNPLIVNYEEYNNDQ